MAALNPIREALSTLLKTHGFKKKSNSWYLDNVESISVVNLQKSQFGDQFYINLGVAFKALGTVKFPAANKCHVRFRLERAIPDTEQDICKVALNMENHSISPDDRKATISRLVETYGLPMLRDSSSAKGVEAAYKDGRLAGAMVLRQVKDLFN